MAVAPLFVVLTAAAIALLLSVFPFRVGPERIQHVFFRDNGSWRPFGRAAWLSALIALLVIAVWVTPRVRF
jgi:hypothetical protein